MNNKTALIALNKIHGIGPRILLKIRETFSSYSKIFELSYEELKDFGFKEKTINAILAFDFASIATDLAFIQEKNSYILSWDEPTYPALLKEIYDPPPIIYAKGNIDILKNTCISMVGTRNPSPTGSEIAYSFARNLVKNNITIVSGLAIGIDERAHQGALDEKGFTIAVLGSGIKEVYPLRHKRLAQDIFDNGLIISEFSLNTKPHALHFPRRNRIISGLSMATLVIEAAVKSGSLITARFSLEQNREVLAIPGSIYNPKSKGCHQLLKQGAKLVMSVEDVLQELPQNSYEFPVEPQILLANEQKNLVKFIGFEQTSVDTIVKRSGQSLEKIIGELANLELCGIVCKVAGGYMRIK